MDVKTFIHHPRTKKVAIGVGLVAGVLGVAYGVGYLVGRREEQKVLSKPDEEELERIRNEVEDLRSKRMGQKPDKVIIDEAELYKDRVPVEGVIEVHGETTAPSDEPVKKNVFANTTVEEDSWVYEEELKNRDSSDPYVIHKDEFYSEESGLTQSTLTYYEGDNILSDEEDKPIYNIVQTVGELKFGHGSGDPNVVYVRNERLRTEYEILRDSGSFTTEVLGLTDETIEHSTIRKFRPE